MLETDKGDDVCRRKPGLAPTPPDQLPERIFARRMKRERLRRGWRQEDLAKHLAMCALELHPSAIAKMEREPDPEKGIEPRMIRLNEAKIIAFALRMSIDSMLSDNDLTDPVREYERLVEQLAAAEAHRDDAQQVVVEADREVSVLQRRVQEAYERSLRSLAGADVTEGQDTT